LRKKYQAGRWLVALGILPICWVLFTGAAKQLGEKDASAPIKTSSGVDISELTDVDALGFLSPEEVKPWGYLFSDETERILLARGDTVYVSFDKGHHIKPGDLFTVFKSSSELDHPLTGSDIGYVISFLGTVVLKQEVKTDLYKAEIVECYRPMRVGDPLRPFSPVSPCVQLSNPEWEKLEDHGRARLPIVASKDLKEIIGQFSVVYINHGHRQGIHRGNLFEIVSPVQPDQPKEPALPDQVIGYVLILKASPTTSVGIVMTARRDFSTGSLLKPIDLDTALKKVLIYQGIKQKDSDTLHHPLQVLDRLTQEAGPKLDLPEVFRLLSKMPKCLLK